MKAEIPELDRSGLRKFGLTTSFIIASLFGLLIPFLFSLGFPVWPWAVAAVLGVWALVAPATLHPVYSTWMKFGHLMNTVNTRVILGLLFFGIILPVGLLMRLLGNDPMRRQQDSNLTSYRIESQKEAKDNAERPY